MVDIRWLSIYQWDLQYLPFGFVDMAIENHNFYQVNHRTNWAVVHSTQLNYRRLVMKFCVSWDTPTHHEASALLAGP